MAARETTIVRIVLEGDTGIVHEELSSLVWIKKFDAAIEGNRSVWTIEIWGYQDTATNLLRAVLADRRLQVIEYGLSRPGRNPSP